MSKFHRILCPTDLSENSCAAIELATTLAKQHEAKVAFFYVSPLWLPENSRLVGEYSSEIIEEEKASLHKLRPTDPSVGYEHHYVHGNAGPTVAQATKTSDYVVMSTHGRRGVMRFLLGSVAHYVLRNSKCPVVLVKGMEIEKEAKKNREGSIANEQSDGYVTEVMHQVPPVHAFDEMESVLADLNKSRETAAPVVDGSGKCIGILTTSDIDKFHSLQARFEAKDETVIDEMFEVDQYGQRRPSNCNFEKVERHMTKEVISIRDSETIQRAIELFDANPAIHHLVILDEDSHAVGIVDALDVAGIEFLDHEAPSGLEQISESKP